MANRLSVDMLLTLSDRISGPLKKVAEATAGIGKAAETAAGKFTKLQNQIDKVAKQAQKLDAIGKPLAAIGAAGAAGIGVTVAAFANLEEAQNRLKTNLMDSTGKVGPEYEKLNKLAEKLGVELPGSTKDMIEMFTALREQGVQTNMILNGYGEAAAKFATVMKIPFAEAATHVAKFAESMGIADKDANEFMDTIQRLKSSSGIETQDLAYTFKYAGGALKLLNLQGIEAAKSFSTVIGMLASAGIEGSTAGTNMAQALARMAEIGHKMDSKKIKELVGPILDREGIKLEFFDAKGNFKGLREMTQELEKLKKLNPQEQIIVLKKLFGDEAARPLAILMKQGVAGFDEMARRMREQADMQAKIKTIMAGTKMQWETLTGTIANVVANIGGLFAKLLNLPGLFAKLNDLFGKMNDWILAHPKTASAIAAVVVALSALALVGGTILMGIAAIGAAVGPFLGGLAAMSRLVGMATMAFKGLSFALLTNPITLTIVAIAAAALLIYKYWGPIKTFFKGVTDWISNNWKRVLTLFLQINPITAPFMAIVAMIKKLTGINLFDAGANIFKTLVAGMKSMVNKPFEVMKSAVQKMRNLLPFSPAKEGPFRDIHRVKIMETIASSMRPGPMVMAMRAATAATMMAAAPMGAHAGGNSGPLGATINFAPTINIAAGTPAETRVQVDQALSTSQSELERMIERVMAQKNRRAF